MQGDGEDIFTRDEPVDTQLVTTLPDQSSKRQKRNLSEKGTGSVAHQESGHGQHRNPEPTLVNQDGKSRKGGKRDAGGIAPTARSALQVRDVLRPIQAQGYKRGIKPFEAKEPAWGSARPKAEELTDNSETSRSHTNDIQAAKRVPPQFKWADYIVEESGWNDDCQGSKLASTQDDECGDFSIQTIWGNDEVVE